MKKIEEKELQPVLNSEGKPFIETETKIVNGYIINITEEYYYDPKSVQEGYELLYEFAMNRYLRNYLFRSGV